MKKRFAAFVSTVLAAVLCACSAAPKDVLPNKAAQPTEAPTQQAQTTQAAPTELPAPEPCRNRLTNGPKRYRILLKQQATYQSRLQPAPKYFSETLY